MFLLFSLYFSSLNLKYLKLTKMDITRFAMKLFICRNAQTLILHYPPIKLVSARAFNGKIVPVRRTLCLCARVPSPYVHLPVTILCTECFKRILSSFKHF